MPDKLLMVDSDHFKRKSIISGFGQMAQKLGRIVEISEADDISKAIEIISGPKTYRERICVYDHNVPLEQAPQGIIQMHTDRISLQFLEVFILGLNVHRN